MENSLTFGRWLKRRRKALDLTQGDLASAAGCASATLYKIEAGKLRPSRQIGERLLACLRIPSTECPTLLRWARAAPGTCWEAFTRSADTGAWPDDPAEAAAEPQAESPFIVGMPIRQPQRFFGRTFELQRILSLWSQSPLQNVAVIAARRSGKTSLLYCLMTMTQADPAKLRPDQQRAWLPRPARYQWVFVDFQDPRMRQRERLLKHILSTLQFPVPATCDLEHFMDVVSRHLRQPTLILMDELGAGLTAPELDTSFWEGLRSLASHYTHGQLGFALAAHQDPARLALAHNQSSPFFNIFGYTFNLGPFTEPEARALTASSPLPLPPADVEWILEQSGRWPCLLQILCAARYAALREGRDDPGWKEEGLRLLTPARHLLEAR
jgi:transcriptional regulator with XRE-family HTH domain